MGRIDYYNDPAAPKANSLVVAVSAVVTNEGGNILLQRRFDNDLWALPGGGMEFGESIATAIAREVNEETGFDIEPQYVVGVYSDPLHVFAYDNGEVRQEYSVCIAGKITSGELAVSSESTEVAFFEPSAIPDLEMHPRIRARITDYLNGERGAVR
jgi:ADP-ribose pyrophosphatase YjhB (NUDIX family)